VGVKWQLPNRFSAVRGLEAEKDKIPACCQRNLADNQEFYFLFKGNVCDGIKMQ